MNLIEFKFDADMKMFRIKKILGKTWFIVTAIPMVELKQFYNIIISALKLEKTVSLLRL